MKQLKFCATLLLFISGILALRGIKPALLLMLAFAGLREIISAKEYQTRARKNTPLLLCVQAYFCSCS